MVVDRLDIGCGPHKSPIYIGMDKRNLPGIDIVHDLTDFPLPITECRIRMRMYLVWGCVEPKHRFRLMDELWRIAAKGCVLDIAEMHDCSNKVKHDPAYYSGINEYTFTYFDPDYEKYKVYEPKPWRIIESAANAFDSMQITMEPRK